MEGRLVSNGVTDALLSGMSDLRTIKKGVLQVDWSTCITEASHHSSTILASQIASKTSWLQLWDMALDQGPRGTKHLQALYRELTRPQFKPDTCHLCGSQINVSYFHHYTLSHTPLQDPDNVIYSLIRRSLNTPSIISSIVSGLCIHFILFLFLFFMPCHFLALCASNLINFTWNVIHSCLLAESQRYTERSQDCTGPGETHIE